MLNMKYFIGEYTLLLSTFMPNKANAIIVFIIKQKRFQRTWHLSRHSEPYVVYILHHHCPILGHSTQGMIFSLSHKVSDSIIARKMSEGGCTLRTVLPEDQWWLYMLRGSMAKNFHLEKNLLLTYFLSTPVPIPVNPVSLDTVAVLFAYTFDF